MPNDQQGSLSMNSSSSAVAMEEKHAQILKFHRAKFVQSVEVERLYPMLQPSVLSQADVGEIEQQPSPQAKVQKLLDILPGRGSQAFQMLCLALETTYPHLLTVMFLGSDSVSVSAVGKGSSQSTVSSYTSESDVEDPRSPRLLLPAGQQNGHSSVGNRSLEFFKQELSMKQSGESVERGSPSPHTNRIDSDPAGRASENGSLGAEDRCHHRSHRNYEQLRSECKKAIMQLESLKRQHSEVMEKFEHANREAEYCRNRYRSSAETAEQLRAELQAKMQECAELTADWEQAKREILDLRQTHENDLKELSELRMQNREVMNQRGSSEVLNKMYDTAWDKYEGLKREYEALKQRNADLTSRNSILNFNTERMEDDIKRLKGQLETAYSERDRAYTERNALKQQCTAVIRKYDNVLREMDDSLQSTKLANQKYEKVQRELNHLKHVKHEMEKKIERVTEERNAAVREYTLVMSERDDVHKEMEKLQEEAQTESSCRKNVEEKYRNILAINEALKGKMYVMSKERDHALREYNELSDRYRDIISSTALAQKERDKALFEFEKFKEERDVARRERTEALDQRDKLLQECYNAVQQQKSISYDYDQAFKEAEVLRRNLDTAEKELKEVQSETDDAKRQRDRAFQERVKIMMERESIRTLCDKLRRERDRAVSDFAEALRNLDDVKRQRNDAMKQLKEMKEKMQKQTEKEMHTGMKKLITHHSRDSAIDADSQEWETETVAIETEREDGDVSVLGFDFGDSKDHTQIPDDCSLIITKVDKGSLADGRLKVNDYVLRVNDIDLTNGDRTVALQAVKKARGVINMVVKRRRSSGAKFCPVTLFLTNKDHGVTLETGIFVSRIEPGSASAKESGLMVGDRMVSVNGESVVNKDAQEVQQMLDTVGEAITLNVMRVSSPSSSSGLPSNASPTAESVKSHETLSSKSSLTPLVSPCEDPERSRSGRNISVQTEASQSQAPPPMSPTLLLRHHPDHFEDKVIQNPHFQPGDYPPPSSRGQGIALPPTSPDWHAVKEALVYPSQRPHTRSEPVCRQDVSAWDSKQQQPQCNHENAWAYPAQQPHPQQQQQHSRQSSQDFNSHGDDSRDSVRHSREGSFVGSSHSRQGSSHSRQSSRESPGRHSGYHTSHSSRESFRENKRQNSLESRDHDSHNAGHNLHSTKENPYRSPPPSKHGSHKKQDSKENFPLPQPQSGSPPEYKTSPAMNLPRRERDGSPRVDPYTERGEFSRGAGHAEKTENSTWPKSRGPPEVYLTNRKRQKRITTIPIMNPPYENIQSDKKGDGEMVPPKPPSRNSSLKASRDRRREIVERTQRSSSSSTGPEHMGVPETAPHGQSGQQHQSSSYGQMQFKDSVNKNNNRDSQSSAVHYQAGSLPDTSVDYTVVSAQQSAPVATQFRPISTPAIPGAQDRPSSESKRAIRRRTARPNQLELSPYSPQTPPPHSAGGRPSWEPHHSTMSQHIEFRSQPAVTHMVRLPNSVPYFKVHSQPLTNSNRPGRPAHPPIYMPSYASSNHSISSSSTHDSERSPSRASLPPTPRGFQGDDRRNSNQSFEFETHSAHSAPHGYNPREDGFGTFPKKSEKRMWMNQKYRLSPGPCLSTSSVERGSISSSGGRDNQLPLSLHSSLSVSSSGRSSVSSFSEPDVIVTRGSSTRTIEIEKSNEPLGIRIIQGSRGGIFVHTVTPGSLAERAELQYGDQILEFNGLNLRQATYDQAAIILSQAGNSISMLVMYNIKKMQRNSVCDSEDATPTSTPESTRTNSPMPSRPQSEVCSDAGTMTPPTPRASRIYTVPKDENLPSPSEPRFVFLEKSSNSLGVGVFGGNAVGIFVYEVQPDGVAAKPNGLQVGDHILEFNGVDLRGATAEQAAMELQKPTEKVSILAQYNIAKFNKIRDQHGDSLYVRALVDYQAEVEDQLTFRKDDILYVDDTMYNGTLGVWSAWLLDPIGKKTRRGKIPSKALLQKDQARKRSISQGLQEEELRSASSRRNAGPARRSLFRRKKHQRSNSDGKEHSEGSVSDIPIQEEAILPTYQRVEPLDFHIKRPVLLLGPLTDRVASKMVDESPDKFNRCLPKIVRTSSEIMLKDLADNVYVDYQRRDSYFECIHAAMVKEITKKGCHCILDGVSPFATERLQMLQLFPIVIFIRYKSAKQIRDQKDPHYIPDRVSHRVAKEMFEHAQKLEQECRNLFSDVVAGGNLASVCTKVKKVIDREQHKTVWVQSLCPL
ncbi:disks large homolog 5-like isoform X2 [Acanthaster planci]|uniref:Disks large homolog 5-like isoform X2 n=1 Tax=Acanthaster planci TaxID=133434 RepID=A0A8B7Z6K4_ACAPL|nr:disks large homolog 5-like isoform X2 [Acanthaster planci]